MMIKRNHFIADVTTYYIGAPTFVGNTLTIDIAVGDSLSFIAEKEVNICKHIA